MAERKVSKTVFINQVKKKLKEMQPSNRKSYVRGLLSVGGNPKIDDALRKLYNELKHEV